MKLLSVKGLPGYRIDCENHKVYSLKNRELRLMKINKAYDTYSLYVNGGTKHIAMTRLEYCALHHIHINKIDGLCVVRDKNGTLILKTRTDVQRKGADTRKKMGMAVELAERIARAGREYVNGKKDEYIAIVMEQSALVGSFFVDRYHRSPEVVDVAVYYAVESIFDKVDKGLIILDPYLFVKKYVYTYLDRLRMRRRQFRDNMAEIII